jgi:hypothetical protein
LSNIDTTDNTELQNTNNNTPLVVMKKGWPFHKIMDIFYQIEAIDEDTAEEFLHVASRAFVVRN